MLNIADRELEKFYCGDVSLRAVLADSRSIGPLRHGKTFSIRKEEEAVRVCNEPNEDEIILHPQPSS